MTGFASRLRRTAQTITLIAIGVLIPAVSARAIANRSFVLTSGQMQNGRSNGVAVALPNGMVLVAGGLQLDPLTLNTAILATADIFDPVSQTFTPSSSHLTVPRQLATATLLNNGKVLITGGSSGTGAVASAELYDPSTDSFTSTTTAMTSSRINHVATLLNDGTVLIAGGLDTNGNPLASAEIYSPSTDSFTALPNAMTEPRTQLAAARLQDGNILIAGGGTTELTSAEVYDPVAKTFTVTAHPMTAGRFNPTLTLLGDGDVLVAGGRDGLNDLASTEIYDPDENQFSPGPNMASPRLLGFSILLPSRQVLVGGGYTNFLQAPTASAELYDPLRGAFRPTSQPLRIGRSASAATNAVSLNDGRVMVVGGQDSQGMLGGMPLASGEIYDPTTDVFTITGGLNTPRDGHTATTLASGGILLVGGADQNEKATARAEIYDRRAGRFVPTSAPLNVPRAGHAAVRLRNGKVLIVGGSGDRTAEIYHPRSDNFMLSGSLMTASRAAPIATLLSDGRVLIAGGIANSGAGLSSAELYDPRTDSFAAVTAPMTTTRAIAAAIRLPNGKVLIAGGSSDATLRHALNSAEIFDPRQQTFTATPAMSSARVGLAIAKLPNARVLLTGGNDQSGNPLDTAEVFIVNRGSFEPTANTMSSPRRFHTATLIAGGTVLLAGGDHDPTNATETTDIYSSKTNSFSAGPSMNAIRDFHTASMLPSGRVLIVGGLGLNENQPYVWPTAELLILVR